MVPSTTFRGCTAPPPCHGPSGARPRACCAVRQLVALTRRRRAQTGNNRIVAVGDGNFAASAKGACSAGIESWSRRACSRRDTRSGAPPSPTAAVLEHVASRGLVALLPEEYTSAMCHVPGCHRPLRQDALNWHVKHCAGCRRSYDRDEVGYKNLEAVLNDALLYDERPPHLTHAGASARGHRPRRR